MQKKLGFFKFVIVLSAAITACDLNIGFDERCYFINVPNASDDQAKQFFIGVATIDAGRLTMLAMELLGRNFIRIDLLK